MNILFPPVCIHCKSSTKQLVCDTCAHFFEFLPKKGAEAACFEEVESVSTFVRSLRHSERCQKAAISFLVMQFSRMGWPIPDIVTSVPRRHLWSSNISEILAQGFAQKMRFPYKKLAKRPLGELPKEEEPSFLLKTKVEAKSILIIDDYKERGKTLANLSRLLRLELRAKIFTLTVAQH